MTPLLEEMRTSQCLIIAFVCGLFLSLEVNRAFSFLVSSHSGHGGWYSCSSRYVQAIASCYRRANLLSPIRPKAMAKPGDGDDESDKQDSKNKTIGDASALPLFDDVDRMKQGSSREGENGKSVTTGSITRIPTTKEDLNAMLQNGGDLLDDQSSSTLGRPFREYKTNSNNRYFQMVEKLAPNEIMAKFSKTAPSNIQEAAKSTIMNILGSLPQYALDASLITTNTKLANLMFQMQITGYMFKNAEYRMSFTRSLKGYPKLPNEAQIGDGNTTMSMTKGDINKSPSMPSNDYSLTRTNSVGVPFSSKKKVSVTGDITIKDVETGKRITVPAEEVTEALGNEIEDLRRELMELRQEKQEELRGNILTYIQALPEKDLASLTSDMSDEAMEAIQLLVDSLMNRLELDISSQDVVIQQPIAALAQLCMWQLVVGYKLRELEALERGVNLD